jgi:hypothetical protein
VRRQTAETQLAATWTFVRNWCRAGAAVAQIHPANKARHIVIAHTERFRSGKTFGQQSSLERAAKSDTQ